MQLLPNQLRVDEFSMITLQDGRVLAYMEWGDRTGFPVFYFHGTPSSRLEGAFADQAALRAGFRLISIDRPGFGQSTFQKNRTFRDWPKDVCALADALEVRTFGVVGHSGAGPHLFACGAFVEPKRLKFLGALGPWGPVATPEIVSSLNSLDRFFANLSQKMPWIMRAAFAPVGWSAQYWQSLFFGLIASSVSSADKKMLKDPDFAKHFRAVEREAFRQGSRGGAYEASIAYRKWDFDISQVQVPTYIWLGDEDIFVPRAMGEYIQQTIPGVQLHFSPGKGHFNIEDWDAIMAACAQHI